MPHLLCVMFLAMGSLSSPVQTSNTNQRPVQITNSSQEGEEPQASSAGSLAVQALPQVVPPPATASAGDLEKAGDELRARKRYNDAIAYYLAAIRKSDSAELHNKAGIAYLQTLQLGKAQKEFSQAVRMNHIYAEALNNRGVVFYMEKKYRKAIGEYQKALKLNDSSASFHSNLGMALFEKREFERGAAEFVRALELDPQIFDRQSHSGISARMASPQDRGRYAYTLARIYATQGIYDRSLEYLQKAIEEGYVKIRDVYNDSAFAGLRQDPRFAKVMEKTESLPN
jgi:tetratricopeptide (TPR) repeat protein